MKKFFRSKLNIVITLILTVGVLASGGIWAYSAAKTSRSNVVTINPSEIKMVASIDESAVDESGNVITGADRVYSNNYILFPGQKNVTKDPVFHVKEGSGWIFVKISTSFSLIYEDSSTTSIENQMIGNGWVKVADGIFGYNRIVQANENIPMFDHFSIKDHAYIPESTDGDIDISGYAMSDSATSPEFANINDAFNEFTSYMSSHNYW